MNTEEFEKTCSEFENKITNELNTVGHLTMEELLEVATQMNKVSSHLFAAVLLLTATVKDKDPEEILDDFVKDVVSPSIQTSLKGISYLGAKVER